MVIIERDSHNTHVNRLLITNARLVNEGAIRDMDVLISGDRIEKIASGISAPTGATIIDAGGKYLLPGMIDDQVHFREPGLTHKGERKDTVEALRQEVAALTRFRDLISEFHSLLEELPFYLALEKMVQNKEIEMRYDRYVDYG